VKWFHREKLAILLHISGSPARDLARPSLSKTPNTLEPLPANKAPHAPASSKRVLARSISGSISKITLSKSLRRGHCLLSAEFRSARELERIEAELEVVKEAAFRDAYASAVETLAFGVMTISTVLDHLEAV
jgi:hypothetical protein